MTQIKGWLQIISGRTMVAISGVSESHLSGCLELFALNFWRWHGPMNSTFLFYEGRLSCGDTHRWLGRRNPTYCYQFCLNFLHLEDGGGTKISTHANSRPTRSHSCISHLVRFSFPNYSLVIAAFQDSQQQVQVED